MVYRRWNTSALGERGTELPEPPEGAVCFNTRCTRNKNLWQQPFTGEWFCWPHYRIIKRSMGQYKGRRKHHDWAVSVRGYDYPAELRTQHHDFARRALAELHEPREVSADHARPAETQHGFAERALRELHEEG